MVKFRCLRSGNLISLSNEEDIESMRKEQSYEEVKDEKEAEKAPETRQVLKLKKADHGNV